MYIDDKKYTFAGLQGVITDRIKPSQQLDIHRGKWLMGQPLSDIGLRLRETYVGVKDFFLDTLHIWLIIGILFSVFSVLCSSITHWRHRVLVRKREIHAGGLVTEATQASLPLMGAQGTVVPIECTSPFITARDVEAGMITELRGTHL